MSRLYRVGALLLWFIFVYYPTCFAEPTSLTICIHDDSVLNPKDLATAVSELGRILRSAGAEPGIYIYSKERRGTGCTHAPGVRRVFDLRIISGPASYVRDVRHPPLGRSIFDGGRGLYAVIFLEPIRHQASAAGVPVTLVLAYVAAHEVGHLLLGANAHSPHGVMKAAWERTDLMALSQRSLHFDYEQRRRIAERWKSTSQTEPAQIR
jgi:hypothetical protein